ncbi:MAG: GAF domain-containing protein [Myxococcota bacterium]
MKTPDVPANEPERLAALRATGILDTAPEDRFDRVTRLAQELFGVEMAFVSLVDERRQWFKSRQGLDVEQTPRDVSFCGHVVAADAPMVVDDATADPRFADNPLVTGEPRLRFYAGYPLRTPAGYTLGTLCLLSRRPMQLQPGDLPALRDLAQLVSAEISGQVAARTDALTGLANRAGFFALGEACLATTQRGKAVGVLCVQLRDGRKLPREQVEAVVKNISRPIVAAASPHLVGRTGRFQFAVLMVGDSAADLDSLQRKVCRAIFDATGEWACDAGYAPWTLDRAPDIEQLLLESDAVLYGQRQASTRLAWLDG